MVRAQRVAECPRRNRAATAPPLQVTAAWVGGGAYEQRMAACTNSSSCNTTSHAGHGGSAVAEWLEQKLAGVCIPSECQSDPAGGGRQLSNQDGLVHARPPADCPPAAQAPTPPAPQQGTFTHAPSTQLARAGAIARRFNTRDPEEAMAEAFLAADKALLTQTSGELPWGGEGWGAGVGGGAEEWQGGCWGGVSGVHRGSSSRGTTLPGPYEVLLRCPSFTGRPLLRCTHLHTHLVVPAAATSCAHLSCPPLPTSPNCRVPRAGGARRGGQQVWGHCCRGGAVPLGGRDKAGHR